MPAPSSDQRYPLLAGPTALMPLRRLSEHLGGPTIYMKRDDMAGPFPGGNKSRKLEYLLADALAKGADTLVTIGGLQSNHCRQTAVVAASSGLDCTLVLSESAAVKDVQFGRNGNLVIDALLGARLHVIGANEDRTVAAENVCRELVESGRHPYLIPVGGSNVVGALGYRRAAGELLDQCRHADLRPAEIVVCSGSGGTQAGLAFGLAELQSSIPLLGVSCWKRWYELSPIIESLVVGLRGMLGVTDVDIPEIAIDEQEIAAGYGVPTEQAIEAIQLCARLEGILLDPVYTGKAMAGLIRRIRAGTYKREASMVFIHTGGSPALFAYDQFAVSGLRPGGGYDL